MKKLKNIFFNILEEIDVYDLINFYKKRNYIFIEIEYSKNIPEFSFIHLVFHKNEKFFHINIYMKYISVMNGNLSSKFTINTKEICQEIYDVFDEYLYKFCDYKRIYI